MTHRLASVALVVVALCVVVLVTAVMWACGGFIVAP